MAAHNDLGKWGEELALRYLESQGYGILHHDWKLGKRDLDIVCVTPERDTLVFVEVKTRRTSFSNPRRPLPRRRCAILPLLPMPM